MCFETVSRCCFQEYIAVSDPEMEPHYECDLCGNQVSLNIKLLRPFLFILFPFDVLTLLLFRA